MFAKATTEFNVESAMKHLIELKQWLGAAARSGTAEHVVEKHVFAKMLAMGATVLQEFFEVVGPGDLGKTLTLENGKVVNRWPEKVNRRLVTVFGAFSIPRFVYGTRPGQKIELAPTDQRLQLPDSETSLRAPPKVQPKRQSSRSNQAD